VASLSKPAICGGHGQARSRHAANLVLDLAASVPHLHHASPGDPASQHAGEGAPLPGTPPLQAATAVGVGQASCSS
jgi:hypothetical protein